MITLGYAQTVNHVPLSEIQTDYIELLGTQKGLFSTKITIQRDYGQAQKYDDLIVRDEGTKGSISKHDACFKFYEWPRV